jgi:membrane associated rhomboid family serine protease
MMNLTPTVKQLLIINVMVFIASQFIKDLNILFPIYFFENPAFRFWQPLTYMFMHGNIMHIAFNMFALVSFGSQLEQIWGGNKFLFFYISCGLGAVLFSMGIDYYNYHAGLEHLRELGMIGQADEFLKSGSLSFAVRPPDLDENILQKMFQGYNSSAVGASGAVYGLLTAFAFMFPNAELGIMFIPIPVKAKYFVPGLLAIDLFLGLKGDSIFGAGSTGVAHFAHIGGALVGFLMMWYWKKNQFNNRRWN